MTVFLIIIVVALFAITIWQLTKIFQLSRDTNSIDTSQVANDKDNRTHGNLMLAFGIAFYIFMLYCFWMFSDRALPAASSEHGIEYDTLLWISLAVIMFVQVITQGLLHWFAFKYKGRKGQKALFFADNDKLEFIWTIIPVIVLAGLIIYGLFTWSSIMNIDDENSEALVIEIYAKQFGWEARYAGDDNTLGKANVRFIEGANTIGVDVSDPYAYDDVVTAELHLPVDRPVIFKFRSQDVLHSAYFPHFRAQMNVVPGMTTQFSFTPTVTSAEIRETEYMRDKIAKIQQMRNERSAAGEDLVDYEQFEYYLLCNKICGVAHYNMQMKIVVETEEEFNSWIAQQPRFSETIDQMQKQDEPAQGEVVNEGDVAQVKN
ncbi:cytochrome c oxidase subunit II [Antarcticibacterium flavum]|uniref:cytochrome-c oxidase n=1 Tax=Antarcticibacterium flavum TaxID=2058175 RepID=A0A5B7X668_9FLAO|nr:MULTISPECIES: cytochrome c oxidase subunit II [Antarcticibacterium]MCM4158349.1 cytochrome c oxidase subunit II [Antarcticibacterium sp. W02-3]QCY70113.1 cytochrome c oxidase subunit II [Antarcticibacterium flavum]